MSDITKATADPIRDSLDNLCAVVFAQSKSSAYRLAVNVCQGAAMYSEGVIAGQLAHVAVFGKSFEQASKAVAVIRFMAGIKTLQIFVSGQIVANRWSVLTVLECYLKAALCKDAMAHCIKTIDNPRGLTEGRYLFPCAFLLPRMHFQPDHPASVIDQVQAAGIGDHVNCCPLWDPTQFRKVGNVFEMDGRKYTA